MSQETAISSNIAIVERPNTASTSGVISFRKIERLEDALNCWQQARTARMTKRYGLVDPSYLPEEYRSVTNHQYYDVVVDDQTVGILGIINDIAMGTYRDNLTPEVLAAVDRGERFSDLGLFFTRDVSPSLRPRIVRRLIEFCAELAKKNGLHALYIQVPERHEIFYRRIGFERAGDAFLSKGWVLRYVPLVLFL